ncbi:MAG TPA: ribonuclease III [Gammaproteobacteria bacterium]|nr:ribonuclease III [Gammaproteobacteria bacterium]
MRRNIDELAATMGYRFKTANLLEEALTHRSKGAVNNERLEFLGDAILGFVVAEILFARFPAEFEGVLTRFRASLVKKETLAELARSYQLGDYLRLGPGELKSGGFRRDSILADAMEAIIGAIYLDSDMSTARDFVLRSLGDRFDHLQVQKDPKTQLQEFLQARRQPLPEYSVTATHGTAHDQQFAVQCVVDGLSEPARGVGNSRRKAEQAAAQQALESLSHAHEK